MQAAVKRVLVIGAGPAGAAAAAALRARCSAECILIERRQFPRPKACAGGLSPWTLTFLDRTEVGAQVRAEAFPIAGARIAGSDPGSSIEFRGRYETAVLSRERFDELLVQQAVRQGVSFRDGLRVRSLLRRGATVVGALTDEGAIEADLTVDCTGANGKLSFPDREGTVLHTAIAWYEGLEGTSDLVELFFDRALSPHYGWVFPESRRRVNVGIVAAPRPGESIRDRYLDFVGRRLGSRVRSAERLGRITGHPVWVSSRPRRLAAPGLVVAGEAGHLVDAATAEGIFYALCSGALAGEVVGEAIATRSDLLRAPDRYSARSRSQLGVRLAGGALLTRLLRTPALDLAVRLRQRPAVRELLQRGFLGSRRG